MISAAKESIGVPSMVRISSTIPVNTCCPFMYIDDLLRISGQSAKFALQCEAATRVLFTVTQVLYHLSMGFPLLSHPGYLS